MSFHGDFNKAQISPSHLHPICSQYKRPDLRKAAWQLAKTFIPYSALWILMKFLVRRGYSYWLVLAFTVLASLFLVRIFIFFHDCAHNSFFVSSRANRILGYICGILTFTPYDDWRRSHGIHHGTAQDLDRRGTGDVPTLTVAEYLAAPRRARIVYRRYRNPFILFGPGPLIYFMIRLRFPNKAARKRERNSVILTDLAILTIIGIAGSTIGLGTFSDSASDHGICRHDGRVALLCPTPV